MSWRLHSEPIILVNSDFSQRVAVAADGHRWVPSPQIRVERVMLDRLGGERVRCSSSSAPITRSSSMPTTSTSLVFKRLRVVRMVDAPRNTLVYLTYSDRVIEGSPQNSVTTVPVDRATSIPVR
jgi:hypothetical protein